MRPAIPIGAAICLVLVLFTTSQPGAAPKFSDWDVPTNLGPTINSPSQDFGPAISKDGRSLYFTSDRQGGFGGTDIWVSHRATENDAWGTPVNLWDVINSPDNDAAPALSRDGHWLFFSSNRPGGFGDMDIWASWRKHTHDEFGWGPPFNLGVAVNSPFFDAGPSLFENDEGCAPLLFFTSNRPGLGDPNTFDIYVSQLSPRGLFFPATLVAELISQASEQRPSIRFDGLEMFFHSNRPDSVGNDLWVSSRHSVFYPWSTPVNLGDTVNSSGIDQQPYIAADRRTLFFASDRPGGSGLLDLYVTTRAKDKP
jgi:Tol biopolymer transport system component